MQIKITLKHFVNTKGFDDDLIYNVDTTRLYWENFALKDFDK